MAENPKDLKEAAFPTEVKYMTEQEEARARLKASIDALTEQASLEVKMQQEPLKMLGGASAVGGVVGLLIGRQFRRSKKIYVDAESPLKHQKALMKAQSRQQSGDSVGGALIATLGTLAFKQIMEKVVTPRLEDVANGLLEKAGQPTSPQARPAAFAAPKPASFPASSPSVGQPASAPPSSPASSPVNSFLKTPAQSAPAHQPAPAHIGVIAMPESKVEAKAIGTPINDDERLNPNAR